VRRVAALVGRRAGGPTSGPGARPRSRDNGAAAARNSGFDRATGDIIVCCDDDVWPSRTVLERLLTHYRMARRSRRWPGHRELSAARSSARRLYRAVFCLGPFRDERQPVYWYWQRYPAPAASRYGCSPAP
jgi:glycosyltransferase involved in cell wall biosynthesis